MNKLFALMGFAASATILLTNCTNQLDGPVQNEKQFSITALCGDLTKTSNDGVATKWVATDSITVFHTEAGSSVFGSNDKFTISESDLLSGRFTGSLTDGAIDPAKSYDWYALFPYVSKIITPANPTSGYLYIGSKTASTAQVQNGNNSRAHLAGKYFPLYAKVTGNSGSSPVSLTFKNALSVVKVTVTNNTSKPVSITEVSMTAQESIVGSYYFDFSGSDPVFTASGSSYVSNTAKLNVVDGEAIAVGASADFYLAIKPFTNTAGNSITISVNGTEKTNTSAATFAPGKIKTVNFNLDVLPDPIYTFDLSTNTTASAEASSMTWASDYCDMVMAKGTSGSDCTNYYPGTPDKSYSSTRAYSGMTLTITPKTAYQNIKIVFETTSDSYASTLSTSTWSNASVTSSGKTVTVTPTTVINPVSVQFGGTVGITSVKVTYVDRVLIPVTGIVLDHTSSEIKVSKTDTLTPIIAPSNATNKAVTWSSNAESIATVEDGIVTGISEGTATITATTVDGEFKASCTVTVLPGISDIVLDMTTKTVGWSSYDSSNAYGDWMIVYGANNNKGWAFLKMGGKSDKLATANPCYIYYTQKVENEISTVTVHLPSGSLSKSGMSVNSWGVYVYSDKTMETQVDYVAGGTITSAEGSFVFKPSTGKTWKNCYVKVSWNLANTTTTNGIVCVDKITIAF